MNDQPTIKSVSDEFIKKLCDDSHQDFTAAAAVRDMQRMVDPQGTKVLTPKQIPKVRAFLRVLAETAYH